MKSFYDFMQRFNKSDGLLGDFVADMTDDAAFPRTTTDTKKIRKYLNFMGASDLMLRIFSKAAKKYNHYLEGVIYHEVQDI